MPPRASARVAAVAEQQSSALAPLPHALALAVFALLPVDQRLRCREVCRGWRAVLTEEVSLWRRLDLSACGVSPNHEVTDGLLRAAAARAAGHLETLDVSGCCDALSHAALLRVVRANSASLRELHLRFSVDFPADVPAFPAAHVEALLRAAPGLRACPAVVYTSQVEVARAMLRADPPFAALRLECLCLGGLVDDGLLDADEVLELAADLAACPFIRAFELSNAMLDVDAPTALDALVDAALARRLHTLRLLDCELPEASTPALARLLGGGALAELEIQGDGDALFHDAPDPAVLAHALRTCSTLTALKLSSVQLWHEPAAATALVDALTGHASLRTLKLSQNWMRMEDRAAAGAAFGALVAANAPALTELDVSSCDLGDAGLRPLFEALPANTHLRTLNCGGNQLSDAFVRDRLLPAVRANTGLRELSFGGFRADAVLEVMALMRARLE
jgi:hypothetical protein